MKNSCSDIPPMKGPIPCHHFECVVCMNPNVENQETGLCASCGAAARKEAKRATQVKIVKPIKRVSAKMAKEKVVYNEKKAKYLEIFPVCQVKGCKAPSTDLHHRQGRGKKLTDETLFLSLCHDHHVYYTEHSAEAIADGISLLRSVTEPHKI